MRNKVVLTCQICGGTFRIPVGEWERYREENFSDTDHSAAGYICSSCADFEPWGEDKEEGKMATLYIDNPEWGMWDYNPDGTVYIPYFILEEGEEIPEDERTIPWESGEAMAEDCRGPQGGIGLDETAAALGKWTEKFRLRWWRG